HLGNLIREGRMAARLTAEALAERAGISRALLHRMESGDPGCAVGAVLEVAAIVGVPLFDADADTMTILRSHSQEKRALLPKAVRTPAGDVQDDF
ncbi:MAG: helix-turn-helix transcriptional regulator, partial [Desulfovibrionaceae bacterium]